MNHKTLLKAAIFTAALFVATRARAADVTVQWDPSSSSSATGYVLLYGLSPGSYSQQFNVGNVTSYTVANLTAGSTYYFAVRSYDAIGTTSALSSELSATVPSGIAPAVTSLSLTSSMPSPQASGTTINWSANAGGGVSPYQYQWSQYHGGSWTTSGWATASTWSWTPTTASSDYQVKVAVRSSGNASPSGEMVQSVPFVIAAPSISSATLSSNVSSPQFVGDTVVWSARGTGGVTPYQYQWWVSDGTAWTAMTGWTSSATWSWSPTVENSYAVRVWIRSAGNLNDAAEAIASVPFVIKKANKGQGKKN